MRRNTKRGAKQKKERTRKEKKRKRNKDKLRREMEYRYELFSARKGLGLHSENSQEKEGKGIKTTQGSKTHVLCLTTQPGISHKDDANLYKKVMLMVSI